MSEKRVETRPRPSRVRKIFQWKQITVRSAPTSIVRGVPSVILGVLLNTLDAASTGLLVFPSPQEGPAFAHLQVQAMSLYIMSTITSQLAMTLGGSLFPGALGSMLIEVLPFLRGIATDIQGVVGQDSPNLLPTVIAAYAMTSFLIGFCFLALGMFRLGWVVEYFPHTVLTGVIGAIGLSLFLLSLQLTLPPTAPVLSLSSAGEVLFSKEHVPLLLASLLPTIFLVVSLRMTTLAKLTRGFTEHAMYVPLFVFTVAGIFWIIVAAQGNANADGMAGLTARGWLFTLEADSRPTSGLGTSWNYWVLFNFSMVQWSAMNAAIQNIVLLVVIGVLNLPIYIPAMAIMLNEPRYSMDWELIGHGVSNLLSGATGSIPNLVVLSNSRLFTFAGGGRPEALVVTGFTVVLFFTSARLLPYVPTILASILVLFLGMDLMAEALWSSAYELLWSEWAIVLGTMIACTFVGFLPGFGIGLGMALVVHFCWELYDLRARSTTIHGLKHTPTSYSNLEESYLISRPPDVSDASSAITQTGDDLSLGNENLTSAMSSKNTSGTLLDDRAFEVVSLSGSLCFATGPSLESQLDNALAKSINQLVIVDFTKAYRCETCIGQLFKRKIAEHNSNDSTSPSIPPFAFAGLLPNGGVSSDLSRGGISCYWPQFSFDSKSDDDIPCYLDLPSAIRSLNSPETSTSGGSSDIEIFREVDSLLCDASRQPRLSESSSQDCSISTILRQGGASIHRLDDGQLLTLTRGTSFILVIRGVLQAKVGNYNTSFTPTETKPRKKPQRPHARRLPLFPAGETLLNRASSKVRRRVSVSNSELSKRLDPVSFLLPHKIDDGQDEILLLGPGDSHLPLLDQADPELGYAPEVFTAVDGPCWVLSIPIDRKHLLEQVLVLIERRRMGDSLVLNRTGNIRY